MNFLPNRTKIEVHFFLWGEPNRCSLFFCWCLYDVVGGCCSDHYGELEGLRVGEGKARSKLVARRYARLSLVSVCVCVCVCLYDVVGGCCSDHYGELEGLRVGEGKARSKLVARRYARLSLVCVCVCVCVTIMPPHY